MWTNKFSGLYVIKMKKIIICIAGESGTGKTTMAEYIEKSYNIPMIYSYTDRLPRFRDEMGHIFITKEEYDELKIEDMIAFTKFGDARYCCLKKDVKDVNTYVVDENGIKYLEAMYGNEYDIFKVRLHRPEEMRNVSTERINRDKGMFNNDIIYDLNIYNNGNLDEFYTKIRGALTYISTKVYLERITYYLERNTNEE